MFLKFKFYFSTKVERISWGVFQFFFWGMFYCLFRYLEWNKLMAVTLVFVVISALLTAIVLVRIAYAYFLNQQKLKRRKKINLNSDRFVYLDIEVSNKKGYTLAHLKDLKKGKTILSKLNVTFNREVISGKIERSKTNLLELYGNQTRSGFFERIENIIKPINYDSKYVDTKFVLLDKDKKSDFFFSILNFRITSNPSTPDDSIKFDVLYRPGNSDSLYKNSEKNINHKELVDVFLSWAKVVKAYNDFSLLDSENFAYDFIQNIKFKSDNNSSKFNTKERKLLNRFLIGFVERLEDIKTSENNEEINEIQKEAEELRKNLEIIEKNKAKSILKKILNKAVWLGKDLAWEIIKELVMNTVPFLN